MIATAGLLGFPNAGKSSFLRVVSNSKTKVANYPFTTLSPHIGTIQFKDSFSFTIADLPGLIEGAHKNRGLGHEFLRHIERTDIICFVIDMSGEEGDPYEDLTILKQELKLYKEELLGRTGVILANKMDLTPSGPNLEEFRKQVAEDEYFKTIPIFPISCTESTDIDPVITYLRTLVEEIQQAKKQQTEIKAINLGPQLKHLFEE